jgi:hypothetical protein
MSFDKFEDLEDFEISQAEAQEISEKKSASICTFIGEEGN